MEKQVKLIISGRVQGVFYRASASDKALQLGIKGWVKNLPDGRVAAVASGEDQAVDDFIEWCKKGPRQAHVSQVQIEKIIDTLDYKDFKIL